MLVLRSLRSPGQFIRCTRHLSTADPGDPPPRTLITGSLGQLGLTLAKEMRTLYGKERVVCTDIRKPPKIVSQSGPYRYANILNVQGIEEILVEHRIDQVIHFSAMLSALGEQNVAGALAINIQGFNNIIELCKNHELKLFCPSTIGAFGPETPRNPTPDLTIQKPKTIYGVSKVYMELLGEYYHERFGLDFRCARFPGIISATSPGGGTTDYAVQVFYDAIETGHHTCFLGPDTRLPMMYISDCIKSVIQMTECPEESLKQRTYNINAFSFTPEELFDEIRKYVSLEVTYDIDPVRQKIAKSWPEVLEDHNARAQWGWDPEYTLENMVPFMLRKVQNQLGVETVFSNEKLVKPIETPRLQ